MITLKQYFFFSNELLCFLPFRFVLFGFFFFFFLKKKELQSFILIFGIIVVLIFINFLDKFLGVFDCIVENLWFEKVCLKLKEIFFNFI